MNHCYFNGKILPYNDCQLHVSDLQFQRGYGIFEFFRVRNGKIPWLEDYTDRLFSSCRLSGIDFNMSRDEFNATIYRLHEKNNIENSAFKVIVTGGYSVNLDAVDSDPNSIILNIPWKRPPEETFSHGVSLITNEYVRPDPEIKTLFYFNLLKLRMKMKEYKAVDVLYHKHLVTETSRASAFFVKNGGICTPEKNILKSVTRKQLLKKFTDIRLEDIPADKIFDFDEIFISSTSRDITPVVAIDGRKIGSGSPGKITKQIMAEFKALEL